MNEISLAIRTLVALVFLTAAVGKIRHRLAFEGVVANYRLIPEQTVAAFALLLPLVEAALAAALVFASPVWPEAFAAVMLLIFAVAMAVNIARGRRHIDCGCFQSALAQKLSWTLVMRNLVMAACLFFSAAPLTPLPESGAAAGVLAGIVFFVLLQSMNILWGVVPSWRPGKSWGFGKRLATGDEK